MNLDFFQLGRCEEPWDQYASLLDLISRNQVGIGLK